MYDIPVVLFTFRRLDTVKLILDKLKEIKPKTFYVFCDAAREGREDEARKVKEVRDFLDNAVTWDCDFHREYAKENLSCSPNIMRGFNRVLSIHPYAIFLEDDAVPTGEFFEYMKTLLIQYENNDRIQYIGGFNGIGDNSVIKTGYTFGSFVPMSGAIGIWADRWNNADFTGRSWPGLSRDKSFRNKFFSGEFYRRSAKEFSESYNRGGGEWDIMLHLDMLSKDRLAITPKGNLVRSYGYEEGAFHVQASKTAKRLIKYMDYTKEDFVFPMAEPEAVAPNKAYDRERQRIFLSVNGNYAERHIHYAYIGLKDFCYKHMPKKLWNFFKKLLH